MTPVEILVTCEHGGNDVPPQYADLFRCDAAAAALDSHRGWDPGSLMMARCLAETFRGAFYYSTVTRLLVELNRSLWHPHLFSEFSKPLNEKARLALLDDQWHPYRTQVEKHIANSIAANRQVLHLSVHSFTPVFDGRLRTTDIGLLYAPSRPTETRFCRVWQTTLQKVEPSLTVHRNAPYKGVADGFVTWLRRHYSDDQYIGIELEVNQRFTATESVPDWKKMTSIVNSSLNSVLVDLFFRDTEPQTGLLLPQ
ncbi:MAG: N-formylglutamate amidohydrolase [Planctomycetaceae bacterium]|nr:N-formylglutamate amidohydrolase [Planctomycetaceae bacterium]